MKKRTGSDQTLSKSFFSYIVYIYIPTPDFSSQATTQSVLHLPVYTMTIHLIQCLPLSCSGAITPPSLSSPLFSILGLYLCFYTEQHYENKWTFF